MSVVDNQESFDDDNISEVSLRKSKKNSKILRKFSLIQFMNQLMWKF